MQPHVLFFHRFIPRFMAHFCFLLTSSEPGAEPLQARTRRCVSKAKQCNLVQAKLRWNERNDSASHKCLNLFLRSFSKDTVTRDLCTYQGSTYHRRYAVEFIQRPRIPSECQMCVMNAWTDRTEGRNSRSAWTSWQRPHRELSADAVSTPGSDMFTTLSHRITHFLRCPRVILLEAFRQLAQQHARHSAGCSAAQNSGKKNHTLTAAVIEKPSDMLAFSYNCIYITLVPVVNTIYIVYLATNGFDLVHMLGNF